MGLQVPPLVTELHQHEDRRAGEVFPHCFLTGMSCQEFHFNMSRLFFALNRLLKPLRALRGFTPALWGSST